MGQEKRTEKHQKAAALRTVEDRLDRKPGALDHAIVLSEAAAITLMTAYGFFDSFYALLLFFPVYIINMKRYMKLPLRKMLRLSMREMPRRKKHLQKWAKYWK